jgi:hypothetical protein
MLDAAKLPHIALFLFDGYQLYGTIKNVSDVED